MERIKPTEKERLAFINADGDKDYVSVNMNEKNVDKTLQKEETEKFNSQLEAFEEGMKDRTEAIAKDQQELGYSVDQAELKAIYSRILVKPYKQNPFQKIETKNGIITSLGGYNPHAEKNPITGRYEEQEQFIITGLVVDAGPEAKYLKAGDVVYYRKDTVVPVPFLNWGLVSLAENQVIAVVNVGLQERFNKK